MKSRLLGIATAIWVSAVAAGIWRVETYANSPGASGASDVQWPHASALERADERPTLVMFLHPGCPCSRATLGELNRLCSRFGDRVRIVACFVKPANVGADWMQSDLVRSAKALPGVVVRTDINGREAVRFGARTSGQAFLFRADGALLFSGGITASRGHHGDNAGRTLLERQIQRPTLPPREFPVFGCALLGAA